jgi:proliferating cell nuclear antigen PCNA
MPVFKAKTGEAYQLKVLAELLTNNLKVGCFEVNEDGIVLRQMDLHRKTLIDLDLPSENFCLYKFKTKKKLVLGLNLGHFHRMLKTIKKKDSLQIYIDEEDDTDLALRAIPKEGTRRTTSYVKIQTIQVTDTDTPTGYGKPVIVTSSEFQKMAKDMLSIGSTIQVVAKDFHICFKCDAGGGVIKRIVEFGEIDENESDSEDDSSGEYRQEFMTEQFTRIAKIAGLSSTMQIFPAVGLPLLIRSRVGGLGHICIYIKSKEQVEEEEKELEGDDL